MRLSKREKEIIYFVLSREIDKEQGQEESWELDNLRSKFEED